MTGPDQQKRWFDVYPYGLGYGPVTWQGWIILAVTVAAIIGVTHVLRH